jgi:DNA-binding response OmpR family regulator
MILLVEDDKNLSELVVEFLESQGFEIDYASDGLMALELLKNNYYELIILDLNLPKLSGIEVCEQLRAMEIQSPCIMLTARTTLDDKIAGFEAGADDYLIKPFAMPELVARIKALTNRNKRQTSNKTQIGDMLINWQDKKASRASINLNLSSNDWKLLRIFTQISPTLVTKKQLLSELWGDAPPSDDAFKMVIYRFRKAINIDGLLPLLHTIRSEGYILKND